MHSPVAATAGWRRSSRLVVFARVLRRGGVPTPHAEAQQVVHDVPRLAAHNRRDQGAGPAAETPLVPADRIALRLRVRRTLSRQEKQIPWARGSIPPPIA